MHVRSITATPAPGLKVFCTTGDDTTQLVLSLDTAWTVRIGIPVRTILPLSQTSSWTLWPAHLPAKWAARGNFPGDRAKLITLVNVRSRSRMVEAHIFVVYGSNWRLFRQKSGDGYKLIGQRLERHTRTLSPSDRGRSTGFEPMDRELQGGQNLHWTVLGPVTQEQHTTFAQNLYIAMKGMGYVTNW